jgi:dihydropteroate synthase
MELESEFYLLPIKDQNQRKMKDGFDDVKNELKNKLDHASEEFKDKFSTAKLIWKKPMIGFKYESQDRRCNFVLEEKLAELKGRTLNFKNNFDLLIVSNLK